MDGCHEWVDEWMECLGRWMIEGEYILQVGRCNNGKNQFNLVTVGNQEI